MPNLEEIQARVERIIHDETFHGDVAIDFINEAYTRCVGRVLIPDLASVGLVTTSPVANSVPIPSSWNFDRNLYFCSQVSDGKSVKVMSSVEILTREYADYDLNVVEGDIEACTATRAAFVYYKTPAVATILKCAFYKKHTSLVNDSDIPSILPEHMHYALLVSGACAEIWYEIEEGIDGVMVNTTKYRKKFEDAITELVAYFKVGQSRPRPLSKRGWV